MSEVVAEDGNGFWGFRNGPVEGAEDLHVFEAAPRFQGKFQSADEGTGSGRSDRVNGLADRTAEFVFRGAARKMLLDFRWKSGPPEVVFVVERGVFAFESSGEGRDGFISEFSEFGRGSLNLIVVVAIGAEFVEGFPAGGILAVSGKVESGRKGQQQ
jgi:hypothetical protein